MRGEVLAYDDGPGSGLISGEDGGRYAFARADLQQLTPVRPGTKVDFVPVNGAATQVFVVGGAPLSAGLGVGSSLDWRALFLRADGRIGQKDYWIGFAILFVLNLLVGWIPLIGFFLSLGLFYGWVCVASKRLHDIGRSGWLVAIPVGLMLLSMIMMLGSLFGGMAAATMDGGAGMMIGLGSASALAGVATLINLAFVVWLGVVRGDAGENRYGPPPAPLANF